MTDQSTVVYQTPEEYRLDGREQLFRTAEQLRWNIRVHRDEYIKAGAVVYPNNRPLIVPGKFDRVLARISRRNALRRAQSWPALETKAPAALHDENGRPRLEVV